MKRVAHVFGLSLMALLPIVGCGTSPAPSTPSPTPSPAPAPAPTVAVLSIAIPAAPLHVGDTERFAIRVTDTDPVSTLAADFGDGISVTVSPVSSSVDLSHVYRAAGTYIATVVATTSSRTLHATVAVRVEP